MPTPIVFLAWKHLSGHWLTLVMMVAAVAAGVGFQIPNLANLDGYHAELVAHGISAGYGDIRVRAPDGAPLPEARAMAERVAAAADARAIALVRLYPGAAGAKGNFRGAPIVAFDSTTSSVQPFRLLGGSLMRPGDEEGVLVGSSLAGALGVTVGDTMELRVIYTSTSSLGDMDLLGEDGVGRYTMTVRGLAAGAFGAGSSVFVDAAFLARESGLGSAASFLAVYIDDHDAAPTIASALSAKIPGIAARAWQEEDSLMRSVIQSNRVLGAISEAMVIVAVAIPVLALLFIHVLRQQRDIGLLGALGFSPAMVFALVLTQAAMVAAIGVAIGCALGYGLIAYFQANAIFAWEGFVIRPLVTARAFLRPSLMVGAVVLLAGLYPAWRAARMDPARVLRGVE